ncbi:MAG: short-chain-enoyl-CoA hydratase [Calditrichia bacterium]
MAHLSFQSEGDVGLLAINRPESLNALNEEVLHELIDFYRSTIYEKKLRGVVLTGAGEKAFIAGADIKAMNDMDEEQIREFIGMGQHLTILMEEAPAITIAAVNGYALGGGLEIALACDFIYASTNAMLGLPEVTLGLIPGFGGTQRLARAIGERRAKEMIFSGKPISADDAYRLGLVNKVVEQSALVETARETLRTMLKNSYTAITFAKEAIHQGLQTDLKSGLAIEKHAFLSDFGHDDRKEGIDAFIGKRKPDFS